MCSQMPCEEIMLLHKHVSTFEGTEAAASTGPRLLQCLKPLQNLFKISFFYSKHFSRVVVSQGKDVL